MSGTDGDFVARLLDAARRDVASDEAQRREKIYDQVIGGAAGHAGGPSSSAPRPVRSWVGVTAGIGALALVGAGTLAVASSKRSEPRIAVGAPEASARIEPSAPPNVVPAKSDDEPSDVRAPLGTSVWELPSVATAAKPAAAAAPAAPASNTSDELALELAVLESARGKLRAQDPATAMRLLDDFDRRFPHPRAGDEATVLRIEVLFGLGRVDDARRSARDFIARRPDSIYRARVAQLLGDAAP